MEIAYRNYAQTVFEMLRQICFAVYLPAAKPFKRMHSSARSQTAQEQHLREVMDRHGNRILRLAYSYVHNMQDAEEILQDTLIKLLDSAPDFESEEHEKAWLIRVAANLSKNRIEYNKLRDTDELNDELVAEQRDDLTFVWEADKPASEEVIKIHNIPVLVYALDVALTGEPGIKALQDFLRPEFLGRVDEVVVFSPLTEENYADIAKLQLADTVKALGENGITLEIDDSAYKYIAKKSHGGKYGGRDILRVIREEVEDNIANLIIDAEENTPAKILLSADDNGISVRQGEIRSMIVVRDVQIHVPLLQDAVLAAVNQAGAQVSVDLLKVLLTAGEVGTVDGLLSLVRMLQGRAADLHLRCRDARLIPLHRGL